MSVRYVVGKVDFEMAPEQPLSLDPSPATNMDVECEPHDVSFTLLILVSVTARAVRYVIHLMTNARTNSQRQRAFPF